MNNIIEKEAYTVEEFLATYGIGRTKFYAEVKAGHIVLKKLGTKTLVSKDVAQAWFNNLPSAV